MIFLKARYQRSFGGLLAFYLIYLGGLSSGRALQPLQVKSENPVTDSVVPTLGIRREPNRRLRRSIRHFGSRLDKRSSEEISVVETAVEDQSFGSGIKNPIGLIYDPLGLQADSLNKETPSSPAISSKQPARTGRGGDSYSYSSLESPILSHNSRWHEANRNPSRASSLPRASQTEPTTSKGNSDPSFTMIHVWLTHCSHFGFCVESLIHLQLLHSNLGKSAFASPTIYKSLIGKLLGIDLRKPQSVGTPWMSRSKRIDEPLASSTTIPSHPKFMN